MGKLSPEKQRQLAELEAERDSADDDDDDYAWVRLESGQTVRLHGARLDAYLKRNGLDAGDVADSSKADPLEPADGAAPPAAKKTVPAKKTAAKKTTAPAADGTEVDETAEVEPDEPPAGARSRGAGMGFW